MILYGSSMSPFVRKVLAFAAEKGIELEVKQVGLGSTDPDFLAASPFRKIPALADGGYTLSDSSAIIHYLDALKPDPELIPRDPSSAAGRSGSTSSPTRSCSPAGRRSSSTELSHRASSASLAI